VCSLALRERGRGEGKKRLSMSKRADVLCLQDIKDFINLLIHEYFGVDSEIVWKVIQGELPALYEKLETSFTRQDSIILNLQRACEASIDAAMHLVRVRRMGIPQESRD